MNIHHAETISGILQVPLSFRDQIEGSIVPPLAHQHRTLHALRRAKVGFEGWQPWHPSGHPATPKEIEQFATAFVNKRFCLEVVRWIKETLKMWLENWEVSFWGIFRCMKDVKIGTRQLAIPLETSLVGSWDPLSPRTHDPIEAVSCVRIWE